MAGASRPYPPRPQSGRGRREAPERVLLTAHNPSPAACTGAGPLPLCGRGEVWSAACASAYGAKPPP
jgi:hypothetical protein